MVSFLLILQMVFVSGRTVTVSVLLFRFMNLLGRSKYFVVNWLSASSLVRVYIRGSMLGQSLRFCMRISLFRLSMLVRDVYSSCQTPSQMAYMSLRFRLRFESNCFLLQLLISPGVELCEPFLDLTKLFSLYYVFRWNQLSQISLKAAILFQQKPFKSSSSSLCTFSTSYSFSIRYDLSASLWKWCSESTQDTQLRLQTELQADMTDWALTVSQRLMASSALSLRTVAMLDCSSWSERMLFYSMSSLIFLVLALLCSSSISSSLLTSWISSHSCSMKYSFSSSYWMYFSRSLHISLCNCSRSSSSSILILLLLSSSLSQKSRSSSSSMQLLDLIFYICSSFQAIAEHALTLSISKEFIRLVLYSSNFFSFRSCRAVLHCSICSSSKLNFFISWMFFAERWGLVMTQLRLLLSLKASMRLEKSWMSMQREGLAFSFFLLCFIRQNFNNNLSQPASRAML